MAPHGLRHRAVQLRLGSHVLIDRQHRPDVQQRRRPGVRVGHRLELRHLDVQVAPSGGARGFVVVHIVVLFRWTSFFNFPE